MLPRWLQGSLVTEALNSLAGQIGLGNPLGWIVQIISYGAALAVGWLVAQMSWAEGFLKPYGTLGYAVVVLGIALVLVMIFMGVAWAIERLRRPLIVASDSSPDVALVETPADEAALDELTLFVTDFVIPLGCSQIDLQTAIIKNSYVNEALSELASNSIMCSPSVCAFGDNFNYLWGKFGSSPMEMVPLQELKRRVLAMDKSYKSLLDQVDRLAAGAGWEIRSHQAIAPFWKEYRNRHNELVKAYRKIKRDRRFAPELYRPGINGPWTQEIPDA